MNRSGLCALLFLLFFLSPSVLFTQTKKISYNGNSSIMGGDIRFPFQAQVEQSEKDSYFMYRSDVIDTDVTFKGTRVLRATTIIYDERLANQYGFDERHTFSDPRGVILTFYRQGKLKRSILVADGDDIFDIDILHLIIWEKIRRKSATFKTRLRLSSSGAVFPAIIRIEKTKDISKVIRLSGDNKDAVGRMKQLNEVYLVSVEPDTIVRYLIPFKYYMLYEVSGDNSFIGFAGGSQKFREIHICSPQR